MKKILFALLCAALLAGCKGVACRVDGTLPEDVASVRLVAADRNRTLLAEAETDAEDHSFTLRFKAEEPSLAMLTDGSGNPLAGLFVERGSINVEYDGVTGSYVVTGTPSNDRLPAVNDSLEAMRYRLYSAADEDEEEQAWEEYMAAVNRIVDDNNDNVLGAYLFANLASSDMEPQQIRDRIARFPKELRNSTMLRELDEYAVLSLKTGEGAKYIDVSGTDAAGEVVSLSSVAGRGKWVLLDFWATWCGPCRGEIPYLVEAYELYSGEGFDIFGVSLDNDFRSWETFIGNNGMTWVNVLGVDAERNSPAAEAYGVRAIPSNFLISPDGTIYARNLRGEALLDTLAEIFE